VSEEDVLEAIGWTPSERVRQGAGELEEKNWEDEEWERRQVVDDLRDTFGKGAKGWDKWVKGYEKNPEKMEKK
jgi:hypothetical protein